MVDNINRGYPAIPDLTPSHVDKVTDVHGAGTGNIVTSPTNGKTIYISQHSGTIVGSIYNVGAGTMAITANSTLQISGGSITIQPSAGLNLSLVTTAGGVIGMGGDLYTNGNYVYVTTGTTNVGSITNVGTASVRLQSFAAMTVIAGSAINFTATASIGMTATGGINMTAATINLLSPTVIPGIAQTCAVEGGIVWNNSSGVYKIGVYINGGMRWATLT